MGFMSLEGGTEELLASYDISGSSGQGNITFHVPQRYPYILVVFSQYSGFSDKLHRCLIDATDDSGIQAENSLSQRYGTAGSAKQGTVRTRRCNYDYETNTLSFSDAGRFDGSSGWANDDRCCPVKEIWGINP